MFNSKTSALLQKTGRIKNTFIDTLQNLRNVNQELVAEDANFANQQAKIQADRDSLSTALVANEKMAKKIEEFLGVDEVETTEA